MEDSTAVNVVFMAIRGLIALAIVGVAFYCLKAGVQFFMLPHEAAQQIQLEILGSKISASGLGAVIFATGVALALVGMRAAPRSLSTGRNLKRGGGPPEAPIPAPENVLEGNAPLVPAEWNEYTVTTTARKRAPFAVPPEISSQSSKYQGARSAQAPPPNP